MCPGAGALAQTTAPKTTDNAPQEVIVTAEKRTSTVQNTPISMTALTGAQMTAQGITGIYDIVTSTPGLALRSAGPGQTELEMRGLSSSGGSAPTVGFYLDETPLSPPAAALNGKVVIDPDLFDLNRAEVLRGPQGTLYGSGSMGGTVKLVTNQPNLTQSQAEISVDASGTHQGGANGDVNAMVNAPIINDKVALRLVGTDKYVSGWIDRTVVGDFPLESGTCAGWFGYGCVRGNLNASPVQAVHKNVNDEHLASGRAELLIAPTDNFSINFTAMDQKITMGGYSEFDIPNGNGGKLTHYQPNDINEPFSDDFKLVSLTVKYETPWVDVTSSTSDWWRRENQIMDDTEAVQNLVAINYFIPITFTETDSTEQFSQELRFSSHGNGKLQWVVGGFYSDLTSIYYTFNQAAGFAPYSVGGAAANPLGIVFNAYNPYLMKQYAAFADITYQLTSSIRLKAGFRYFRYDTNFSYSEAGWGTASGNATPTTGALTNSAQGIDPSFNISWRPDKDLTVYASASKGFRPGGVNLPAPVSLCGVQPLTFAPDSVWNYELGEKARLFDNRLTLNTDFYYIQWDGVQQLISPPCDYPYTTNAGAARSYGPEAEAQYYIGHGFTVSGNGTYTTAGLTSVAPGSGLYVGEPLLNIPQYSAAAAIAYKRTLDNGYVFTARLSDDFSGKVIDLAYLRQALPAYSLMKARIGLAGDKWSVSLFSDNLTNTRAILTVDNTAFSWIQPQVTRATTNQPMTIGVNLDYKY